jgi:hypothetical protein
MQEPEVPPKQTAERQIQAATRLMPEPKVYEFSKRIGVRRDVWQVTPLEPRLQTPLPKKLFSALVPGSHQYADCCRLAEVHAA